MGLSPVGRSVTYHEIFIIRLAGGRIAEALGGPLQCAHLGHWAARVMILVTGATGKVGRHVVAGLAAAGRDVRALVRDPARAALPAGVETAEGDLADSATLAPALRDVDAVYLMWPGLPVDLTVIDLVSRHARHVAYLSTDVPDLADGAPAISFHQEIERRLRHSDVDWTFLRAIDFATNTLAWADQIRGGVVRLPHGRAARSLIHERDIADVAVHVLTTPGHAGRAYVLTGPESVPQAELAAIVGAATGRSVRWEEQPLDEARAQLTAAWGNASFVEARLAAWASFVETPERVTDTVERLLGRPARSFRDWAEEHAEAFL
jgi:uncharacterized protein YbjT (DUF2867 family)